MEPFPKVLRIEPASKCNVACVHCSCNVVRASIILIRNSK